MATIGQGGISRARWTFSQAFAAQSSAAIAVITASALGIPVSTSHCLVGAVMGCVLRLPGDCSSAHRSNEQNVEVINGDDTPEVGFNWGMIRNIAIGAVATPILSGSLAALSIFLIQTTVV